MKLITPHTLARTAALRWKGAHSLSGGWKKIYGVDTGEIFDRLIALGSMPEPEKVDAIIGNTSMTDTRCDECGANRVPVIELGQSPGRHCVSRSVHICPRCIDRAMGLALEARPRAHVFEHVPVKRTRKQIEADNRRADLEEKYIAEGQRLEK
jgi:hypothetical protein